MLRSANNVASASSPSVRPLRATDFENLAGRGAKATIGEATVHVGGPRLLDELELTPPAALEGVTSGWEEAGRTVMSVVRTNEVIESS